ncbi:MAG: hypothetical protein FWB74_05835 [Defluviitaleaceae bacterium]|nr:hypothetical protein [Defluviitaleaceae bacterium]
MTGTLERPKVKMQDQSQVADVENVSFAADILQDLVEQGLGGGELVAAFKKQYSAIRGVIAKMHEEAEEMAEGKRKGATMQDIFGED